MYRKQYQSFLSEVYSLEDTKKAIFSLSNVYPNVVIISGSILGQDAHERIIEIGKKYGLHVLAKKLMVMNRNSLGSP